MTPEQKEAYIRFAKSCVGGPSLQDALASIPWPEGTEVFMDADCNISNNPKSVVIRELGNE